MRYVYGVLIVVGATTDLHLAWTHDLFRVIVCSAALGLITGLRRELVRVTT